DATFTAADRDDAADRRLNLAEDTPVSRDVRVPLNLHITDAAHPRQRALNVARHYVFERARGGCQHHAHMRDTGVVNVEIANLISRHAVAVQLRLDHRAERFHHLVVQLLVTHLAPR